MKKIYLAAAIASLAASSVSAADLKFYMGDTEITPGSEVKFTEVEMEDYGGGVAEYRMDPQIYILSNTSGNVTVTANCTSGQNIQLCCGGQCAIGKNVTKNASITANKKLGTEFECIFYTPTYGETLPFDITTTLSASMTGDDKVEFVIVMNPKDNAVSMIGVDRDFRFNGSAIEYNVPGKATVELYDLSGRRMLAAEAEGTGAISTASLPAGIYTYSVSGAVRKSGKIAIR